MCLVRCPSRICRQVNAHVQWYRHELRVGFDLLPSHDTLCHFPDHGRKRCEGS